MKSCQMYRFIPIMLLCVCLFTGGCSQNKDQPSATHNQTPATEAASHTDHTPQVLTPQADGTKTFTTDTAVIDISHTQEGYIMAKYTGSNAKPKLQLTGIDGITYTYSLYKDYSTFPLTSGDGTYQVGVYENVSDDRYTTLLSETFSVTLTDPLKPYLYPNQYVNFTADSLPVAKAEELADGASSDLDIISSVYNYIITHFTYDYSKASSVTSGYLPDIDEVFTSEKGICFDYAAIMACMLRSQGIPTRLEVGYMKEQYHAWVSTYIPEKGWINGVIRFDGKDWEMMDPTFASTSHSPKKFVTENDNYTTKYIY